MKKRGKPLLYPASFQVLEQLIAKTRDEANGFYYTDLANASKLSLTTISNFMNRRTRYPRFHTVWALAKSLGVDVQFRNSVSSHSVVKPRKVKVAAV